MLCIYSMLISFIACAKNTIENKEQKIEKTFDVKVVLDKIEKDAKTYVNIL
ncbi:hypothetical protein [uncultured Parvimonas sp.]|uniref:hypothetical protein n=1 Tax=uncultured Parvimonas sp. TaxID=747372 RepID=UPI002594684D|nr:hypothetical protein [uncultured Parvimonas sp.]